LYDEQCLICAGGKKDKEDEAAVTVEGDTGEVYSTEELMNMFQ
jgi:hypothetical protein